MMRLHQPLYHHDPGRVKELDKDSRCLLSHSQRFHYITSGSSAMGVLIACWSLLEALMTALGEVICASSRRMQCVPLASAETCTEIVGIARLDCHAKHEKLATYGANKNHKSNNICIGVDQMLPD